MQELDHWQQTIPGWEEETTYDWWLFVDPRDGQVIGEIDRRTCDDGHCSTASWWTAEVYIDGQHRDTMEIHDTNDAPGTFEFDAKAAPGEEIELDINMSNFFGWWDFTLSGQLPPLVVDWVEASGEGSNIVVTVGVVNRAPEEATGTLQMWVDDNDFGTRSVTLPAETEDMESFTFFGFSNGDYEVCGEFV